MRNGSNPNPFRSRQRSPVLIQDAPPPDIFSFARPPRNCEPCYPLHFDWDNVAVVSTCEFARWWDSLPQETRKNVRRSQRRGFTVNRVAASATSTTKRLFGRDVGSGLLELKYANEVDCVFSRSCSLYNQQD